MYTQVGVCIKSTQLKYHQYLSGLEKYIDYHQVLNIYLEKVYEDCAVQFCNLAPFTPCSSSCFTSKSDDGPTERQRSVRAPSLRFRQKQKQNLFLQMALNQYLPPCIYRPSYGPMVVPPHQIIVKAISTFCDRPEVTAQQQHRKRSTNLPGNFDLLLV